MAGQHCMLLALALNLAIASCSPPTSNVAESPVGENPPNRSSTAPDFTLHLGDGATFTLYAESRPVFMVFWAEW